MTVQVTHAKTLRAEWEKVESLKMCASICVFLLQRRTWRQYSWIGDLFDPYSIKPPTLADVVVACREPELKMWLNRWTRKWWWGTDDDEGKAATLLLAVCLVWRGCAAPNPKLKRSLLNASGWVACYPICSQAVYLPLWACAHYSFAECLLKVKLDSLNIFLWLAFLSVQSTQTWQWLSCVAVCVYIYICSEYLFCQPW